MKRLMLSGLIYASACASVLYANASPVTDSLSRPATEVAHAETSVLIGAAAAKGLLVAVGERGIIVTSDDAGVTWRQAHVPVSVTLTAVQMLDEKQGFVVGHGGVVLATSDGAQTWQKLVDGVALSAIAHDTAKASNDSLAIRSAELLVADGPDKPLLSLHFFDARHGIVLGAYNLAFSTEDGGQTWTSIGERFDNPRGLHLYAISARDNNMLVAGEQGLLFLSQDAGRTFKRVTTPYQGSFFIAELPSDGDLLVAGLRANVWRSPDLGLTWFQVESAYPASFTASATNGAGRVILGNQAGQLFNLERGHLVLLPNSVSPPLNALVPLADGHVLTVGGNGATLLDEPIPGAGK